MSRVFPGQQLRRFKCHSRHAPIVLRIDVSSAADKHIYYAEVSVIGSVVERRASIYLSGVYISINTDQQFSNLCLAVVGGGVKQRRMKVSKTERCLAWIVS